MDLTDKTAIVTGASGGIGSALSNALVAEGSTVYGLARSTNKLENIEQRLGSSFKPVTLDITDKKAIDRWIHQTFGDQQQPDVLINNAGLARFAKVEALPLKDWHNMVQTNLTGVFYMTRKIVPLMKAGERSSHIINIASIASKVGSPQLSGYNASKFGLRGFSKSLFKELRYDGIKVTCFCPGSTATDFFSKANDTESHDNMMQPEDVAQVLVNTLETPDNFLIDEITMRPLNPKHPDEQ